jgi:hypothetical protein
MEKITMDTVETFVVLVVGVFGLIMIVLSMTSGNWPMSTNWTGIRNGLTLMVPGFIGMGIVAWGLSRRK